MERRGGLTSVGHSIPIATPHASRRVVEEQLSHAWEENHRRRLEAAAEAEGAVRAAEHMGKGNNQHSCAKEEAEAAKEERLSRQQQQPPALGGPTGSGDRPFRTVALFGGRVRTGARVPSGAGCHRVPGAIEFPSPVLCCISSARALKQLV